MKKTLFSLAVSAMALAVAVAPLVSCGGSAAGGGGAVQVAGVALSDASVTLSVGGAKTIRATVMPDNASNKSVAWINGDSDVVSLVPNGAAATIAALAPGRATITVATQDGGMMAACEVYVAIPVTGVKVQPGTLAMAPGGPPAALTAAVQPDNATNKNVTWISNNSSIAAVAATPGGSVVTPLAVGVAFVTAITQDGGHADTCMVTVSPVEEIPPFSIFVDPPALPLSIGESHALAATVLGVNGAPATNQGVVWTTGKPDVADVSADGVVTAIGVGTATITATSVVDSDVRGTCDVGVSLTHVPPVSITVSPGSGILIMGGTTTLTAAVYGEGGAIASTQGVTWGTDRPEVAVVSPSGAGCIVTAVGGGMATITATSIEDTGVTGTCSITVNVPPSGIAINAGNPLKVNIGSTGVLRAVVYGEGGATASVQEVTWASSDENVMTIDRDTGAYVAVGAGGATITAVSVADDGVTGECLVTVVIPPAGVAVEPPEAGLAVGQTLNLSATVYAAAGEQASNQDVTWTSSAPGVASVNQVGTVTAVGVGSATITATSVAAPNLTGTCAVTVVAYVAPVSVTIAEHPLNVPPGATGTLHATVLGAGGADASVQTVMWMSSNTSAVTVDFNTGAYQAVGIGTSNITAVSTVNGVAGACTATVAIPPAGVTVEPTEAELPVGQTVNLSVAVLAEGGGPATVQDVTWTSSSPGVATVSQSGTVTAVGPGSATITAASAVNPNLKATCAVTVYVPPVSITIAQHPLNVNLGASATLNAVVYGPGGAMASTQAVTWGSSDESVITVDPETGLYNAVGGGTATITATSAMPGFANIKGTCQATVAIPPHSITVEPPEGDLTEGDTFNLSATVLGANGEPATVQGVTWSSSNAAVAAVSPSGMVTAVTAGSATITAASIADPSVKGTCAITVNPYLHAVSVSLNKNATTIEFGDSEELIATVYAAGGLLATNQDVAWVSLHEDVATVMEGLVTPVLEVVGAETATATIRVVTVDGNKTADCIVTVIPTHIDVTGVTLSPASMALKVNGAAGQLTATVLPNQPPGNVATNQEVSWKSSAPEVATVDQDGLVTPIKEGKATITVTTDEGDFTATCEVTVEIAVENVTLSPKTLLMGKGGFDELVATVLPNDATNRSVVWFSYPAGIVEITPGERVINDVLQKTGTVRALEIGTTTITVVTVDGSFFDSCEVEVTADLVLVTGVTLDKYIIDLGNGGTETLEATLQPNNATDTRFKWEIVGPASATVVGETSSTTTTATATVTAIAGAGSTRVRVTALGGDPLDPNSQAECVVNLSAAKPVEWVALNRARMEEGVGGSDTVVATVMPFDATNKNVTWNSDDAGVATVNEGVIAGLALGSATIKATSQANPGASASLDVTVTAPVPAGGVTLNKTSVIIGVGERSTEKLVATVTPPNATNKALNWSSNNTSVATVGADGLVSAVGVGSAIITVETASGGYSANCNVQVTAAVSATGVSLDRSTLSLAKGTSGTLSATVLPVFPAASASDRRVSWSSDGPTANPVATVSSNGTVHAHREGSSVITVTTIDGGHTAECLLTVIGPIPVQYISLNAATMTLDVGSSETLVATIWPLDATNQNVAWKSDNSSVAAVTSDGVVLAKSVGATVITATPDGGGAPQTCSVTVAQGQTPVIHVTGVTISKTATSIAQGGNETLTANVQPTNADIKGVSWSIFPATGVATVVNGLVTVLPGAPTGTDVATITVTAADTFNGVKSAECKLTVTTGSAPDPAKIVVSPGTLTFTVGDTGSKPLTATLFGSDGTTQANSQVVTWSHSDPNGIGLVVSGGPVNYTVSLSGTNTGSVTLTATADGFPGATGHPAAVNATCVVTVNAPSAKQPDRVEIDAGWPSPVVYSIDGSTNGTLTAKVYDEDNNAIADAITWASEYPGIIYIDSATGAYTPKMKGSSKITVTTTNGKSDFCTLTVLVNPKHIVINGGADLDIGDTAASDALGAVVYGDDAPHSVEATNQTVNWKSNDTGIIGIGLTDGIYTPVLGAGGNTTIDAWSMEPGYELTAIGSCDVIVTVGDILPASVAITPPTTPPDLGVPAGPLAHKVKASNGTTDATNQGVTWSSDDDPSTISITAGGVFTVKVPGVPFTIKANSTLPGYTDKDGSCILTGVVMAHNIAFADSTLLTLDLQEAGLSSVVVKGSDNDTLADSAYNGVEWEIVGVVPDLVHPGDGTVMKFTNAATGAYQATSKGTAKLQAKSATNDSITPITRNVEVVVKPHKITVSPSTTSVALVPSGQTRQMTATVLGVDLSTPADSNKNGVTWEVDPSDESIATVDSSGLVTPVVVGVAYISARSSYTTTVVSENADRCEVTVTAGSQPVTSVALSNINLAPGETGTPTANVQPPSANDKSLTWTIEPGDDPSGVVDTLNATSGAVKVKATATHGQTATMTAKTNDGSDISETCTLTVEVLPATITITNAASVDDITYVDGGVGGNLQATVKNATDFDLTSPVALVSVTWDLAPAAATGVVNITSGGAWSAKGYGTTTIQASCTANSVTKTITCPVEVTVPAVAVEITSYPSAALDLTDTDDLVCEVYGDTIDKIPASPDHSKVKWESNNTGFVTVVDTDSTTGGCEAAGHGQATITVTVKDPVTGLPMAAPALTDSCTVDAVIRAHGVSIVQGAGPITTGIDSVVPLTAKVYGKNPAVAAHTSQYTGVTWNVEGQSTSLGTITFTPSGLNATVTFDDATVDGDFMKVSVTLNGGLGDGDQAEITVEVEDP
jgi:uncharacterized protein YjdB